MTHSKFPWTTHPHTPTAVFDGDGRRIIDQWVAPDDWQDIETAPKECVPIDVWCLNGERVPIARWIDNAWRKWGMDGIGNMDWIKLEYEPTHWMPIPNAPAVAPTPLDPDTAAANAVMIAGLPGLIEALEIARKHLSDIRSYACNHENRTCGDYDAECSISMGEWFSHDDLAELDKVDAVLASIGRTL